MLPQVPEHFNSCFSQSARIWVFLPWAPSTSREDNLKERGWRKCRNWHAVCCGWLKSLLNREGRHQHPSLWEGAGEPVCSGSRGLRKRKSHCWVSKRHHYAPIHCISERGLKSFLWKGNHWIFAIKTLRCLRNHEQLNVIQFSMRCHVSLASTTR